MLYLVPANDSFIIYYKKEYVPKQQESSIIEVQSLPEGHGILKRAEDGSFFYEVPKEVVSDPLPELTPVEESLPEKVDRLDGMMAYTQLRMEYLIILTESNSMV